MKEFFDITTQNESSLQLLSLQHTEESKRIEEVDDRENFLALYNAHIWNFSVFSPQKASLSGPAAFEAQKLATEEAEHTDSYIGAMGFHVYWSQKEERDVNCFLTC